MEDDKVKVEFVYGFTVLNPTHDHHIVLAVPEPRNALEAAWWIVAGLWQEIILPSLLFALAFTAFKFAMLGHF